MITATITENIYRIHTIKSILYNCHADKVV